MKVLVSGSTGMVGTALLKALPAQRHEVARLSRPASQSRLSELPELSGVKTILWDSVSGLLDPEAEGADAVVHLAGASIADMRWTPERKQVLSQSRVGATRHLVGALGKLRQPPKVFIAASAIGLYGNRGDEVLTEESAAGEDFLARLAREWEAESSRAAEFGARVVLLRFGIILDKKGGALPQMAMPFRLGVGGRVGSGEQWMSWIALEDIVRIIIYAINTDSLSGPANAVAPNPVRNAEFSKVLASVLHRPSLFPAPAFALRLLFGELANSLLLASQRVLPKKLEQSGYRFVYPELEPALEAVLGSH